MTLRPLGRPPARSGCFRIGCRRIPVVSLRSSGGDPPVVVSYCATHAGSRALDPGIEVIRLVSGFAVCLTCGRVLPARLATAEHFTIQGEPCPSHDGRNLIMEA